MDVLIFPVISWHLRLQRPQQLALALAELGHRVIYLDPQLLTGGCDRYRVLGAPRDGVLEVAVRGPARAVNMYRSSLSAEDAVEVVRSIEALRDAIGHRPCVALVDHPFWRPVAMGVSGARVVYDLMDLHAGFTGTGAETLAEEERLIEEADGVVVTAKPLGDVVSGFRTDSTLIPNGVDLASFTVTPRPEPRTAGYVGAIADWYDDRLLAAVARAMPGWRFVLAGHVSDPRIGARLAEVPNIELLGEVDYAAVPRLLSELTVGLIPFKINDLTRATNPVKLYEYQAVGLPVVATRMPEVVAADAPNVRIEHSPEGFRDAINHLAATRCPDSERTSQQWAHDHSWAARADHLDRVFDELFPKVSVIVLAYGRWDLTERCLDSLLRWSLYPDLELVVVDNASPDDAGDLLEEWARVHPSATVVRNRSNLGFAGGMNSGLAAASGDYLVLLNNDTVVTPGWLGDLVRHLQRDPGLGLVGPITNNIGNEGKVHVTFGSYRELRDKVLSWTVRHRGELYPTSTLGFFAVALSRATYERLGPLSLEYERGMFEDDDYCRRVEQAGLRVGVADDAFVFHELSATFGGLGRERQRLFERNRERYEAIWGAWVPHRYRNPMPDLDAPDGPVGHGRAADLITGARHFASRARQGLRVRARAAAGRTRRG